MAKRREGFQANSRRTAHRDGRVAGGGQLLRAMAGADAATVLVEHDFSHPMQAVPVLGGVQPVSDDVPSLLTERELEIFRLIGQGVTTGNIAQQLHLSTHTVDSHREKMRHKLGVKKATNFASRPCGG